MTFKRLLIILTFTVTAIIIMLLGTSYAWYQFDNAVTAFNDVQTFNDSIDELTVVFTNDDNINTTVGIPILAAEVDELSSKTTFSITPNSYKLEGRDVAFQIELINLIIDSSLTSTSDLKYSLLEKIGNRSTTTIASGNFKDFKKNGLILKSMTNVATYDVTYAYEFRLWLEDNGCTIEQINNNECNSQNDLMGKSITGRIKVSTAVR